MIGHDFPYLDTRDLNLDWLLRNMKQILADWAEYQQTMNQNFADLQAAVNQFETDITTAFDNLHDFVDDYFDNLDVQQEINNKLDDMKRSGELAVIMNPLIASETAIWLSEHITNPSSPPVDTSLSVSGAAADAKTVGDKITFLRTAINNASQAIYKASLSPTDGLIPFNVKSGDVIIIQTADGSNFYGYDQIRYYNAAGDLITYSAAGPDTENTRKITYTAAEAFYIGVTQVGEDTIEYIITNASNTYNFDNDIIEAQNAIKLIQTNIVKIESGTFTEATGTEKVQYSSRARTQTPIPVHDFVSVELPSGYSARIFLLNEEKEKLSLRTWQNKVVRSEVENAAYINLEIRNNATPSASIVDEIDTIEAGIVYITQNDVMSKNVDNIINDLYYQTVILTDNGLHLFPIPSGTTIVITTADGSTLPDDNPYLQLFDSTQTYVTQFSCSSAYGTQRTVTVNAADITYIKMYNVPSKAIKVYIPDNNKIIPQVEELSRLVGQEKIVVDASGSGDYTSFTEAIFDTVDSEIDVLVKPGTYDIVAEYTALFGAEAVNSMADSDNATFNGFQYGVRLRKRKVEFAPGAHLVCDWTGHTVDGTHRFSALGVDYDVEIVGLDLDATATFYCIHDDYGINTPYTVKYVNCRVIGHSIVNADCIGGGCKKYSRHILENCYFDNNLTTSATVRYHNTNAAGAEPEIYVSNCYFSNWFTPRWYGEQTSKMRVYVNNCEARSIHKLAESASFNVDNVVLYKWCNTETNPVT